MFRFPRATSLVALWAIVGCGAPAAYFDDAQRAAVADTIRAEAEKVIAALASKDVNNLVQLFTPDADLVYVDNGHIYPNRDALAAAAGGFFKRIGSAGGKWDPAHVIALSPTAGAFTGIFRPEMVDTAGQALWTSGKIWTFVYQRRATGWQIVQAHEVNARPGE
ncbi:MAG: hypothetical protein FJ206_05685 [Gemmatimonadetes bacterium]|nr:hypothetical protein [Gemmatimonadota bacterium]